MRKYFIMMMLFLFMSTNTYARSYKVKEYRPLSQKECWDHQTELGLRFCPYDNDHLAGAALACGGLNKMPTGDELQRLARKIYHQQTDETTIYGTRDDKLMKRLRIWSNDSHIFFWAGEEAKDGEGTYVRMFAAQGSIPYYAPRDGTGYVSHALGKVDFGKTKRIRTRNPKHDSNLVGMPNNDVLQALCVK